MREYGIWSAAAGGFIDYGYATPEAAQPAVAALVEQDEDADDLKVLEMCQEHRDEEQPADGCESCNAESDDAEEDEDDE